MDVEQVVRGLEPSAAELDEADSVQLPKQSLTLTENSVVRLAFLLRNVSALAEIESGNARLEFTSVNLRSLVLEAAEETRGPASEKGIDILAGVPMEDLSFVGDGRKIRQVIVGLLLVCSASVKQGPVRLTAEVTHDLRAAFEVCAPGHELPAEAIGHILGGAGDGDAFSHLSDTIPALSIWTRGAWLDSSAVTSHSHRKRAATASCSRSRCRTHSPRRRPGTRTAPPP